MVAFCYIEKENEGAQAIAEGKQVCGKREKKSIEPLNCRKRAIEQREKEHSITKARAIARATAES